MKNDINNPPAAFAKPAEIVRNFRFVFGDPADDASVTICAQGKNRRAAREMLAAKGWETDKITDQYEILKIANSEVRVLSLKVVETKAGPVITYTGQVDGNTLILVGFEGKVTLLKEIFPPAGTIPTVPSE